MWRGVDTQCRKAKHRGHEEIADINQAMKNDGGLEWNGGYAEEEELW